MGFFEHYFNLVDGGTEAPVCCPFPHATPNGIPYTETHASASVNLKEKLFHCNVCNIGHSEVSFIKAVLNCTFGNALRINKAFQSSQTVSVWDQYCKLSEQGTDICTAFGITDQVIKELHIANRVDGTLDFPVFLHEQLVDVRTYTPNGTPKMKSQTGAAAGYVIPLDIWLGVERKVTLICAGEKDMAVARSHGFNAITITGGEMNLPLSPNWFIGKDVVILYDNDEAGKLGGAKLASYLLDYCASVKNCTNFHTTCKEHGEDITDFFNKYHGTREQLIAYMNATTVFTKEDAIKTHTAPMVTLQEATKPEFINKLVRSNIQIAAISEVQYVLPSALTGEKYKQTNEPTELMNVGEVREWELSEHTVQDILHLIDNNFNEETITQNAKNLMKIPKKEKYIRVHKQNKLVVYKAYVTEMFESMNTNTMPMEYTAYSINNRLESGKKYMVTYKLVPHPYKGQQLIMIITDAICANDSVSNFRIGPESVQNLKVIQELPGTVSERINTLTQKVKGLLGYNGNDTLIQVLDLAYHTVLSFNFGTFQNVRGYLDTMVVGESRVGKSSTADTLRTTYELGTFTSLAGNSATVPGLIGGSNKTSSGALQTKAGLIPQNHKGLIIFEEFGKCDKNIVAELTDVRSSNEVRITRISGTLTLPAMVRMISLSNVKTTANEIKSIASYPNGVAIVTELVQTAEDIARYDLIAVLGDKGNAIIDPFWTPDEPLSKEVYQTRVRWVWSRTTEQVVISKDVGNYIIKNANDLNEEYNCHIKIFGTEAWKKLSRLSIAVAGYLVSTDETYSNLVVLPEHVDYAVSLYKVLYDNPTFRLKEYVLNERKYNRIDQDGISVLQLMYAKAPALLMMLEQEAKPSRNTLMAAAGLDLSDFNALMSQLIKGWFVKLIGSDILPTERFRLGMAQVDKRINPARVGEIN